MRSPIVVALVLLLGWVRDSSAQGSVRVVAAGDDGSSRLLRELLAAPRVVRGATDTASSVALRRSERFATTVMVLGTDARVASSVRGDVVVVGGDLFLHPGAVIDGRAIAIGGGVYNSALAQVAGGVRSFRDHTFDVSVRGADTVLSYRRLDVEHSPPIAFPLVAGLRIPSYDRVNGLSLPWGPVLTREPRIEAEPIVTWRSHLGAIDASARVRLSLGRRTSAVLTGGRATLTNDGWIRSDPINGLTSISAGSDVRNYYRADRIEGRAVRVWERPEGEIEGSVGVMSERAWSVGPRIGTVSAPWSAFGHDDAVDGMLRPNPAVDGGRISSALVDARARWQLDDVAIRGSGRIELPWSTPGDRRFTQTTIDGEVEFPTFRDHRYRFSVHGVVTTGDRPPAQRFAYLGGSGTLPTIDSLLVLGGDQLFWAENRYIIPFARIRVPFLGSPKLAIRHLVGSAGVDELPSLTQNVGLRLTLGFLRVEWLVDPSSRESNFSAGVTVSR